MSLLKLRTILDMSMPLARSRQGKMTLGFGTWCCVQIQCSVVTDGRTNGRTQHDAKTSCVCMCMCGEKKNKEIFDSNAFIVQLKTYTNSHLGLHANLCTNASLSPVSLLKLRTILRISIIIIIIITTTIFIVLSSWQGHCESSLGSSGECITAPSGRRPSDQATWLGLRIRLF